MGYRNITVDGHNYRYIVGKEFVKVVGVGAAPKVEVGEMRTWPEYCCEYACMIVGERRIISVQPSDIAKWIQKKTS